MKVYYKKLKYYYDSELVVTVREPELHTINNNKFYYKCCECVYIYIYIYMYKYDLCRCEYMHVHTYIHIYIYIQLYIHSLKSLMTNCICYICITKFI